MLCPMGLAPAVMVRDARRAAGLSARALAARARVPTTTVTRIERGTTDPTFGMLRRLLEAAGHELQVDTRALPDARPTLASLANAVEQLDGRERIDWTRLRAFADWANRHPDEVGGAIAERPRTTGTVLDAILAGMGELLAERAGVPAPGWTRSVPIPRESWAPPGTPAMRQRAESASPEAFRRRNVLLPPEAIFRDGREMTRQNVAGT